MLKDLTRKAASYPGWTEMASNPQGMQKGRGWIKIRRSKDAYNLYGFLTSGAISQKPLKVYLWSTARSPPELLRCNCDIPRSIQTHFPPSPQDFYPAHRTLMFPPPLAPSHAAPPPPPPPTYVLTPTHTPINTTTGLLQTHATGIFIANLDYAIDARNLQDLIHHHMNPSATAATVSIESCIVKRDAMTGRSRGTATVKFKTVEAAAAAVRALHGTRLLAKVVSVRFDVERDVVVAAAAAAAAVSPSVTLSSSSSSAKSGDELIIANGSE
jgi:hypothetical protein